MKKKPEKRNQPKQYVVVARHGHSIANWVMEQPARGHYYEISGADRDAGLTNFGRRQTLAVARLIRELTTRFSIDHICSSDFERTLVMAHAVEEALPYKVKVNVDDGLAKRCYGAFWNLTYKGLEELFPAEHRKFVRQGHYSYRPPTGHGPGGVTMKGENYSDLKGRVWRFKKAVIDPSAENFVLITHSATKLTLRQLFVGLSNAELLRQYESQEVRNGSVDVYCRNVGGRKWSLVATYEPVMDDSELPAMIETYIIGSSAA